MADNVQITAGSGTTVAADDVSSVYYQIVKLSTGADGVAGSVVSDSNPLPVDDAGGSLTVDNAGLDAATFNDNDTFTRGSSGLIAGLAGIYESTVSTLTAGKVALARLTKRGAIVTSKDFRWNVEVFNSGGTGEANNGDLRSGSAVFYNWNDERYPGTKMFYFYNGLDTDTVITFSAKRTMDGNSVTQDFLQFTLTASGGEAVVSPYPGGDGAESGWIYCPALRFGLGDGFIKADPTGTPTTGTLSATVDFETGNVA